MQTERDLLYKSSSLCSIFGTAFDFWNTLRTLGSERVMSSHSSVSLVKD